jgi:predicted PurR-regulated permease PerM
MPSKARVAVLTVLSAVVLYYSFEIVRPFLLSLISAATIAIAFYPMHRAVERRIPSPSWASVASIVLVTLVFIVPVGLLVMVAVGQGRALFNNLSEFVRSGGLDNLIERLQHSRIESWGIHVPDVEEIRAWLQGNAQRVGQVGWSLLSNVVGNLAGAVGSLFFVLFVLFFFFRDGGRIFRQAASWTPLTTGQANRLAATVRDTVSANVNGVVIVGLVQGSLTGGILAILGVPSAVFWGMIAALASVLPPFGASVVWLPAAIFLMATGHLVKGLILLGFGAAIIASADNVVRPFILQGKVRMGMLPIFLSLLGGLKLFGLLGLFLGPVIFALTQELVSLLRDELTNAQPKRTIGA